MLGESNNDVKHVEHKKADNVGMSLQERINQLFEENPDKSQSDLSRFVGVSRATVSDWRSGKTKSINSENAFKTGTFFNVSPEWLVTGKDRLRPQKPEPLSLPAPVERKIEANAVWMGAFDVWDSDTPLDDDEVALPFFREVKLAAGNGISEVQENHGCKLRFSKSTLRKQSVDADHAACVTVSGNSMEPVLPDGCTIGIDTSKKTITNGKVYAIDHNGELRVKMLYNLPGGGIRLRSFNHAEWPDEHYQDATGIRILGQIFWSSVLW
jgi:phage repressor protein C with HTH and peptisase S24 domain